MVDPLAGHRAPLRYLVTQLPIANAGYRRPMQFGAGSDELVDLWLRRCACVTPVLRQTNHMIIPKEVSRTLVDGTHALLSPQE